MKKIKKRRSIWIEVGAVLLSISVFLLFMENAVLRNSYYDLKIQNLNKSIEIASLQDSLEFQRDMSVGLVKQNTKIERTGEKYKEENVVLTVNYEEREQELIECLQEQPFFLQIAKNVAEAHEYKANTFDCEDFSEELVSEYQKNGYRARIVRGYWYYTKGYTCEGDDLKLFDCRHMWVEIETPIRIEATTGEIIPPSVYRTDYKEMEGWENE